MLCLSTHYNVYKLAFLDNMKKIASTVIIHYLYMPYVHDLYMYL